MTKNILIFILIMLGLSGCNSSSESTIEGTTNVAREVSAPTVEVKPSDWYIRLIAEDPARNMKTGSTQLGELDVSDAVSKHTLKALSPFGGSYLEIVFVDPDGVAAGDYASNFHIYQEGQEDDWTFTVRTDDIDADIILTWLGLYILTPYVDNEGRTRYSEQLSLSNPLLKQMKIVDTSSGEEIPVIVEDKVQTYVFNMNGQNERTFRWILETEEIKVPEYQSKMTTLHAKVLKKDASFVSEERLQKKVEAFDLNKPPMIREK